MTDAEYQAATAALDTQQAALDVKRAALELAWASAGKYPAYPCWMYHATRPAVVVNSAAEAEALGAEWTATPPTPAGLTVTALEPDTAALGAPSFTITVRGTGFAADAVIVWNGSDEVTTVVSATALTTGVNMATAAVAMEIPVAVRSGGVLSNALAFTLTEAGAPLASKMRRKA